MNVHHLELFYYVATHGGISRAVRNIPYGIQQPAVSGQMLRLEESLGKRLFERKPFRLTPEGEELYAFVAPFFSKVDAVGERLRSGSTPILRIGGSELVLRDHVPELLRHLRTRHPGLRVALRSGFQAVMQDALLAGELDLAIVPLEARPPAHVRCRSLVRLPLELLVPKAIKAKTAAELLAGTVCDQPLICLPPSESVSRLFRRGLEKRKLDWPVALEASSLDLIARYVSNGYGIGVSVSGGAPLREPGIRALPLVEFDPLEMAALWNGEPTPLIRDTLDAMAARVASVWPSV